MIGPNGLFGGGAPSGMSPSLMMMLMGNGGMYPSQPQPMNMGALAAPVSSGPMAGSPQPQARPAGMPMMPPMQAPQPPQNNGLMSMLTGQGGDGQNGQALGLLKQLAQGPQSQGQQQPGVPGPTPMPGTGPISPAGIPFSGMAPSQAAQMSASLGQPGNPNIINGLTQSIANPNQQQSLFGWLRGLMGNNNPSGVTNAFVG